MAPSKGTHLDRSACKLAIEKVGLVNRVAFHKVPLFCRVICLGSAGV